MHIYTYIYIHIYTEKYHAGFISSAVALSVQSAQISGVYDFNIRGAVIMFSGRYLVFEYMEP